MTIHPEEIESVAVIGSGISGLQAANLLLKENKDVVVFEKYGDIGGVWRTGYDGYGLQLGRDLYKLCENGFIEKEVKAFCKATELRKYIKSYAEFTNVMNRVKFNKELVRLSRNRNRSTWILEFADGEIAEFDFVVIATGQFSKPNPLPMGAKDGSICCIENVDSKDFCDASLVKDRNVVVVGIGKSGVDCALLAVHCGAKSVTVLARKPHYIIGQKLFNLIPSKWVHYSRIGGWLLPPDYNANFLVRALHKLFFPLKWLLHRIAEVEMRAFVGPKYRNAGVKRISVPESFFHSAGQVSSGPEFGRLVDRGEIVVRFGLIQSYTGNSVVFAGYDESLHNISGDFVINATGYTRSYDFFDPDVRETLDFESDGLWLYRRILPAANVDNLAFVGCECITSNVAESAFIQSKWIAEAVSGRMRLPSSEKCVKDVLKQKKYYRKLLSRVASKSSQAIITRPLMDTYVRDMNFFPYRKIQKGPPILGLLAELFLPYTPADYVDLIRPVGAK